jgi:hypothetical protein
MKQRFIYTGALSSNQYKILLFVSSYPFAHFISLTTALVIGIAFDGMENLSFSPSHYPRMNPIGGCSEVQKERTRSDLPFILILDSFKKIPFSFALAARKSQEKEV